MRGARSRSRQGSRSDGSPRRDLQRRDERAISEVVLESKLHVARPYLRPVDDAEVAGTVARRRIAEHWIVARILRFDAELDALAALRPPVLDEGRVEHVDSRPADVERARRGAKHVRPRTRERALVEIVVQPVVNLSWRRRVADQVRPLRAIPERAAKLGDL